MDSGNGHRAALSQETRGQEAAVAKANTWRHFHSTRLGVSCEEIDSAILRGWTSENVESLPASDAARIGGTVTAATVERLKNTPQYGQEKPPQSTAMADAFREAKN